jgi:hypothetical protein
MAVHSAYAISGGVVTGRRAPPTRGAGRRRVPASPAPGLPRATFAQASLTRPRRADPAWHRLARAPRRAGTLEEVRL